MSHFTVLVIGDNVEEQLRPYHEYECTGEDDEYVVYVDIMEEATEDFNSGTTIRYRNPAGELVESDDSFYRELTPEEKKEHGGPLGIMGTGCGGGKMWTSKDWGDGKGYRAKMFQIPEGFEEVRVEYEEVTTLHERTASWWGLEIIEGDAPRPKSEGYVRVKDGVMVEAFKYTNPNKKWDWYSIGGRWSNMLVLKPIQLLPSPEMFNEFGFSQAEFLNLAKLYKTSNGKFRSIVEKYKGRADDIVGAIETYLRPVYPNGVTGRKGLMGSKYREDGNDRCDQCRIGDLDIERMEQMEIDEALEEYDRFLTEVLAKCESKTMHSWEYVREEMYPGDIDGAREFYNNQEMLVKAREAKFSLWGDGPDKKYHLDKDPEEARRNVIEDARCRAFSTFAVVKDGKWYERGEMGWWGMVSDEKLKYDWNAKFSELIHNLPDDTIITVVDCHI